jgi:hypothetical protein
MSAKLCRIFVLTSTNNSLINFVLKLMIETPADYRSFIFIRVKLSFCSPRGGSVNFPVPAVLRVQFYFFITWGTGIILLFYTIKLWRNPVIPMISGSGSNFRLYLSLYAARDTASIATQIQWTKNKLNLSLSQLPQKNYFSNYTNCRCHRAALRNNTNEEHTYCTIVCADFGNL